MTKGKGGNNNGPWGKSPGSTPPPPRDDIDELIRKSQERFRGVFPGGSEPGSRKGFTVALLALVVLWLASGIYRVEPEEEGVELRFGKYHETTMPGLRYHLPFPIETVYTPQVTRVQRIEIGYRGTSSSGSQSISEESLMLTGDENIIDITFNVQWKVSNAKDFLFNIRHPGETVKDVAESVMREVIGKRPLTEALTGGKADIENENKILLQQALDSYGAGIHIDRVTLLRANPPAAVMESFRDVQAAKADQERLINQAKTYSNEITPKSRGMAERLIQEAEAYRAEVTNRAEGDTARFISIYKEYAVAKDITKKRLYLETIEDIMQGMDKVILDGKNQGVVPYMALPELKKKSAAPTASQGAQ